MANSMMQVLAGLWPEVWGTPAAPTPAPGTAAGPHVGQGVYGLVPGATTLPSPSADLAAQFPGLGATNAQLSSNIYSKLQGQIPQDVQNLIQDRTAAAAVGGGMPGAGLYSNRKARDLGLTSLDLMKQGAAEYNATIPTIKATQTVSPETQIALSQSNAALAAAPDPALAGTASMQIFDRYLQSMANRGRTSPAGGTGSYSTPYSGTTLPTRIPPATPMAGLSDEDLDWDWYIGGQGLPGGGTGAYGGGYGVLTGPNGTVTYDPNNGLQGGQLEGGPDAAWNSWAFANQNAPGWNEFWDEQETGY